MVRCGEKQLKYANSNSLQNLNKQVPVDKREDISIIMLGQALFT